MNEAIQPLEAPAARSPLEAGDLLPFPLPPTSGGPAVTEPPRAATPAPPPVDELTALRAKVAEQERVIGLAKTRVETLLAQGREAVDRAHRVEKELAAAQQREAELLERLASLESAPAPAGVTEEPTLAELTARVAALEALVAPSRPA